MVRPIFEINVSYDMDTCTQTQIVSCKPDRIFYIPVPNGDDPLVILNASICAFACAINQHCDKKYLVRVKHAFPLPMVFARCIEDFNNLSGYSNVEFTGPRAAHFRCRIISPFRIVHLLSGGKDSVYQLLKLVEKHGKQNITAVYVGGTTINAEYLSELSVAKRISKLLDVHFSHIRLEHADYKEMSLCARTRTIWRDMLLFCMARMFGQDVSTGITSDPYFHVLEKEILAGTKDLHNWQGVSLYFSNTNSAINAMSSLLGCKILCTEPEIVILHEMEKRWPELMAICRSCYNPIRVCNSDLDWEGSCSKCKTLAVLRSIIYHNRITPQQAKFVLSSLWQNDTTLQSVIRQRISFNEVEEEIPILFKEVLQSYE